MKHLKKFNENVTNSNIRSGNLGRTSDFTPWIVYDYDTSEEFDVTDEQSDIFDDDYSKFDDQEVRFQVNGSGKAVVNLMPVTKWEIELDHIDLEYLNSINEMLDPMGKWIPDDRSDKEIEEVNDPTPLRYVRFCDWLCNEKDFDFYDGQKDFEGKWSEVANSQMTAADKASRLADYLDEKWGLYEGYQEVLNYLKNLFK